MRTSASWWMNEKRQLESSGAGRASDAKFILEMRRVEGELEKKKREEELRKRKLKLRKKPKR